MRWFIWFIVINSKARVVCLTSASYGGLLIAMAAIHTEFPIVRIIHLRGFFSSTDQSLVDVYWRLALTALTLRYRSIDVLVPRLRAPIEIKELIKVCTLFDVLFK